jgi:hypothetical protein
MEKVETKPKATDRPKRKRVGARDRLAFSNLDPNRQYRIIDATPERLATFEDAGYRVENIKDFMLGGQRTDVATPTDNSISVGGTKKQILVSIDRELYEFDQAEKQREGPDAREAGIKSQAQSEGLTGEVKLSTDTRQKRT